MVMMTAAAAAAVAMAPTVGAAAPAAVRPLSVNPRPPISLLKLRPEPICQKAPT